MKIAIVGGHMAPALGFINVLPKESDIVYIGRQYPFEKDLGESLEQKTIRERGIRFVPLRSGRMQRKLSAQTIPSLLKIPQGLATAYQLLKKEKPDVVVGFGGYLSVPIGISAKLLRMPLVIHESTIEAGLANKVLAPLADRICISWESSRAFFPMKKTVLTGDPLLPFATDKPLPVPENKEKLPFVVVTGGSAGSHAVNTAIMQILPELLEIATVLHLTGDAQEFRDYDVLLEKKESLPQKLQKRYRLEKFLDPEIINSVFAKADLVIGRSGINTVATLLMLSKKAILIPLLVGQKDEQLKNAKLMESEGLATIIDQHTLSANILFQAIRTMLDHKFAKLAKWHIPLIKNGAENLLREVKECVSYSHNEK